MMGDRDTGSERDHLEAAAAKGNAAARATLTAHPCPPVFRSLYRDFMTLSLWRSAGGMGPAPLTLHDVREYETRMRPTRPFLAGELDLLKRMDAETLTLTEA